VDRQNIIGALSLRIEFLLIQGFQFAIRFRFGNDTNPSAFLAYCINLPTISSPLCYASRSISVHLS
jgi:hypothetical protein